MNFGWGKVRKQGLQFLAFTMDNVDKLWGSVSVFSGAQHLFSQHTGLGTSSFPRCSNPPFFILLKKGRRAAAGSRAIHVHCLALNRALDQLRPGPWLLRYTSPHLSFLPAGSPTHTVAFQPPMLITCCWISSFKQRITLSTLVTNYTDRLDGPPTRT